MFSVSLLSMRTKPTSTFNSLPMAPVTCSTSSRIHDSNIRTAKSINFLIIYLLNKHCWCRPMLVRIGCRHPAAPATKKRGRDWRGLKAYGCAAAVQPLTRHSAVTRRFQVTVTAQDGRTAFAQEESPI